MTDDMAAELAAGQAQVSAEHVDNGDGTETVTRILDRPDGSRMVFQPTTR